ncbi:hypothetical protein BLNAU_1087 [Blattamonas nauphoetae]|uniref:Uncharacterized protein n=1 Tax=Blattamonas nauphoetae TaxID=2049346 RepID=A0ABQ9YJS1_9EUKA|nr:hypothetical protein BLNAU_1087 [Blattamonas nauphoetae]
MVSSAGSIRTLSLQSPSMATALTFSFAATLAIVVSAPSASPHHPHPPTPLCLSLTTHTLPLHSASPSPRTPSHSPLPLPHHPYPPSPLCLPSPPTPSHTPLPLPKPLTTPHLGRLRVEGIDDTIELRLDGLPFSRDCSPFLNWNDNQTESESEKAVVLRSLVATLKLQPALDNTLEAKAVKLLESVNPKSQATSDAFFYRFASNSDDSVTAFMQYFGILLSSVNQSITTAAMKMLDNLLFWCSAKSRLALVQADLILQNIITLNPLSLPFTKAADIHTYLMKIVDWSISISVTDSWTCVHRRLVTSPLLQYQATHH